PRYRDELLPVAARVHEVLVSSEDLVTSAGEGPSGSASAVHPCRSGGRGTWGEARLMSSRAIRCREPWRLRRESQRKHSDGERQPVTPEGWAVGSHEGPELKCARSAPSSRWIGSVNVNVEPSPRWLFAQIRPPCNSMNLRARASPRPVPSTFLSAVPTCR